MLEGGLVARRPYLIVGPSGTGKTTLALQFLCDGVRQGERVLLVTLEEPPNEARINHRGLAPELERVDVFDAIPDIMRYERVPFKDIASVRHALPFGEVPLTIRRSPELSAVEVTMAALEQMLRTEVIRKGYSRLVIDSLTALQYFCMKGFDAVAGAQTFLRFLSDLRVTTILTVESPLEDLETPERAIARGEIRLFRWELDNQSVRAIGVEKFRGSPHDVRLHPYRIGPKGIDIQLQTTISRDTRRIIETVPTALPPPAPTPIPVEEVLSPLDPLAEEVRDLVLVGAEVGSIRTEIEAALGAAATADLDRSHNHIARATALAMALTDSFRQSMRESRPHVPEVDEALHRIVQRGEAARMGIPPTKLPPPKVLEVQLEWVLSLIPPGIAPSVPLAPPSAVEVSGEPTTPPVIAAAPEPVELPTPTLPLALTPSPPIRVEVLAPSPIVEMAPRGPEAPLLETRPSPPTATASVSPPSRPGEPVGRKPTEVAPVPSVAAALPPSPEAAVSPLGETRPPALPIARSPPSKVPAGREPVLAEGPRPSPRAARPVKFEERPPLPHPPSRIEAHARATSPREAPPRLEVTAPVAARVTRPLPSAAPSPVAPPSPAPAATPAPVAPTPAPKRRRKSAAPSRRKTAATAPRAESAPPVSAGPSPTAPTPAEAILAAEGAPQPPAAPVTPGPAPAVKPKKRAVRKRKAPPVVAATAGSIPSGVSGGDPAPPPSTDLVTPPKENP